MNWRWWVNCLCLWLTITPLRLVAEVNSDQVLYTEICAMEVELGSAQLIRREDAFDFYLTDSSKRLVPLYSLMKLSQAKIRATEVGYTFELGPDLQLELDIEAKSLTSGQQSLETELVIGYSDMLERVDYYVEENVLNRINFLLLTWKEERYSYSLKITGDTYYSLAVREQARQRILQASTNLMPLDLAQTQPAKHSLPPALFNRFDVRTNWQLERNLVGAYEQQANHQFRLNGGIGGGIYRLQAEHEMGYDALSTRVSSEQRLTGFQWSRYKKGTYIGLGDISYRSGGRYSVGQDSIGVLLSSALHRDSIISQTDHSGRYKFLQNEVFEGTAPIGATVSLFVNDLLTEQQEVTANQFSDELNPPGMGNYRFSNVRFPSGRDITVRVRVLTKEGEVREQDYFFPGRIAALPKGLLLYRVGLGQLGQFGQFQSQDGLFAASGFELGLSEKLSVGLDAAYRKLDSEISTQLSQPLTFAVHSNYRPVSSLGLAADALLVESGSQRQLDYSLMVDIGNSPYQTRLSLLGTGWDLNSEDVTQHYQGYSARLNIPLGDLGLQMSYARLNRYREGNWQHYLAAKFSPQIFRLWKGSLLRFSPLTRAVYDELDRLWQVSWDHRLELRTGNWFSLWTRQRSHRVGNFSEAGFDLTQVDDYSQQFTLPYIGVYDVKQQEYGVSLAFANQHKAAVSMKVTGGAQAVKSGSFTYGYQAIKRRLPSIGYSLQVTQDRSQLQSQLSADWKLGANSTLDTRFSYDHVTGEYRAGFGLRMRHAWLKPPGMGIMKIRPVGQHEQLSHVVGEVYYDSNTNGRRDANERGLSGMAVRNNLGQRFRTDSSGRFYSYSARHGPQHYYLDVDRISADLSPIEGMSKAILMPGQLVPVQLGVAVLPSITGKLSLDVSAQHDTRRQIALDGYIVELLSPNGEVIADSVTDGSGEFYFDSVKAGSYTLQVNRFSIPKTIQVVDVRQPLQVKAYEEWTEVELGEVFRLKRKTPRK